MFSLIEQMCPQAYCGNILGEVAEGQNNNAIATGKEAMEYCQMMRHNFYLA
jgi:hypothetical protein